MGLREPIISSLLLTQDKSSQFTKWTVLPKLLHYYIALYLNIYKAPLAVWAIPRRSQCRNPGVKRNVFREQADEEQNPDNSLPAEQWEGHS